MPAAPECAFGALLNFVGRHLPPQEEPPLDRYAPIVRAPAWCSRFRWYVEQVPWGHQLHPTDLYQAMVATRRQRLGVAS